MSRSPPISRIDVANPHRSGQGIVSVLGSRPMVSGTMFWSERARENIDPSDMAHGFHVKILDDLASVRDRFRSFRRSSACSNLQRFADVSNALMDALYAAGSLHFRAVRLPMDDAGSAATPKEERFCVGASLVQLVLSAGHLRVASSANNAAIISNLMKH